jgi:hypothetical protein
MDAEAIKATDHGFLCDSPCTPFHMHGECYCIEKMHRHDAQELSDAVIDALEAQGWTKLRAKLSAGRG